MDKDFKKVIIIDTNIVLDSANNVFKLSQNCENLIIIPSIVLKELRKYKVGTDEIAYQCRTFNRVLNESNLLETKEKSIIVEAFQEDIPDNKIIIEIWQTDILPDTENDDLIVNTALDVSKHYTDKKVIMVSNDIDVRTVALLNKLETESMKVDKDESLDFDFHLKVETEHNFRSGCSIESMEKTLGIEIPIYKSSFEIYNPTTGKPTYFYRKNNHLEALDEKMLEKQQCKPINLPQKFMSAFILDESIDVVVVEGRAGSGKSAISLSNAMRLLDTRRDLYNKIVYIRKSVPSVDKESQIGFLKGSESDKLKGFLAPLISTLEYFVESKAKGKEKLTSEAIEAGVEELISKYNITPSWEGFLRGSNIRNAVVIIDETSNFSRSSLQLILTRLANSKAIIIGSNRQNDSYYLNKFNNGLTHTLKLCKKDNGDVTLAGVILQKAIRSKIAEWSDSAYE